ncbi:MAG: hypothetical protein F6K22_30165 [Okeania sp. SIO2F4]|uniref:hypothetical protein n=1 Tax=Okeania sp. SIO2F4 TaxID=2607790 RepID=UPI00142C77C5|nr:hypothetical protein [Okeania sp. SIO2F4]NES06710.1 hypothetical protein [Okeania sp. SIO2F4]
MNYTPKKSGLAIYIITPKLDSAMSNFLEKQNKKYCHLVKLQSTYVLVFPVIKSFDLSLLSEKSLKFSFYEAPKKFARQRIFGCILAIFVIL